jgi:NET1-associated nuclear protein 1 (U3 small nucleolar RNA-associated protein 17)
VRHLMLVSQRIDPHESPTTKSHSIPLAVHPLSSTLILPSSHPSSLQIYSPLSSTLLSELEISPSNRVSRREDKPVSPARVEKVVISSCGLWMATVDCRVGDADFHSEVYLKFWSWVRKDESWSLNTRIDRPHGSHRITDISFSPDFREPQMSLLVTIAEDYRIKVWQLQSIPETETSTSILCCVVQELNFYRYLDVPCNTHLPV